MSYESPITLIRTQTDNFIKEVNEKTDEVIFKAVVNVLPQVNKEELIKALEYDRGQYIKGYQDRDKEIVRCKDCEYYRVAKEDGEESYCYIDGRAEMKPNDFCSWAKVFWRR